MSTTIEKIEELKFRVDSVAETDNGYIIVSFINDNGATLSSLNYKFVQTEDATEKGVAVQPYGLIFVPKDTGSIDMECRINDDAYEETLDMSAVEVGYPFLLTLVDPLQ